MPRPRPRARGRRPSCLDGLLARRAGSAALVPDEDVASLYLALQPIERAGSRSLPGVAVGVEPAAMAGTGEALVLLADEATRVRADGAQDLDLLASPPHVHGLFPRRLPPPVAARQPKRPALPRG